MLCSNYPNSGESKSNITYINFNSIDEEILSFMDKCIEGVYNIIIKN